MKKYNKINRYIFITTITCILIFTPTIYAAEIDKDFENNINLETQYYFDISVKIEFQGQIDFRIIGEIFRSYIISINGSFHASGILDEIDGSEFSGLLFLPTNFEMEIDEGRGRFLAVFGIVAN